MAFTEVFKYHHAGSGKRSGSMLDTSSFSNRSILFSITCTPLLLALLPFSYQVKGSKLAYIISTSHIHVFILSYLLSLKLSETWNTDTKEVAFAAQQKQPLLCFLLSLSRWCTPKLLIVPLIRLIRLPLHKAHQAHLSPTAPNKRHINKQTDNN